MKFQSVGGSNGGQCHTPEHEYIRDWLKEQESKALTWPQNRPIQLSVETVRWHHGCKTGPTTYPTGAGGHTVLYPPFLSRSFFLGDWWPRHQLQVTAGSIFLVLHCGVGSCLFALSWVAQIRKRVSVSAATSINVTTGAGSIYMSVIHSLCKVIMIFFFCKTLMQRGDARI